MSEKTNATADRAAGNETAANIEIAAGIISTVQCVMRDTAESRDALPPGSAGSMGTMLCVAMDLLPCPERGTVKTSLGDVAHILGASFLEKTAVSPTITAALADIIEHATQEEGAHCTDRGLAPARKPAPETEPATVDERGRKYVATIQPPPDVAAAGITAIEIWSEVPIKPEELDTLREAAINTSRRGVERNKELDNLRKETDSLMDLVAKGGLRDEETRKQVLRRLTALLHKFSVLNQEVGSLPGGKARKTEVEVLKKDRKARATAGMKRVPDWRDGASAGEAVSGSARTQKAKPVKEDKPVTTASQEAKPAPGPKKDGTAQISGYFTPEEAENLIVRIREWFSACRRDHDLSDLTTTIEKVFELSDGQLGELLGVSSRLVCHVRHGRPSPFVKARFTEIFGVDGGAK